MISSLVLCCAQASGHIPQSNGYRLLGALSKLFQRSFGSNLFHAEKNVKKNFALSSLYPVSFWERFHCACEHGMITVAENELFAFRISFLDDAVFEEFRRCEALVMNVACVPFQIMRVSMPDGGLSTQDMPDSLMDGDAIGAEFRFITPTGFSGLRGAQVILPTPLTVFSSLSRHWRALYGSLPGLAEKDSFADVVVHEYALKSTTAAFKNGVYKRGFIGTISYGWERCDKTRRTALMVLSRFALYAGLGYKTTMGLGQVVPRLIVDG